MRSSGRPTPSAAWRPPGDFQDAPPTWRSRPPLESTTYTIVPRGPATRATSDDALTGSQRASIDVMHASMESLTHYELLGVKPTSDARDVTRAFEALASAFSPTRFARMRTGAGAESRLTEEWQDKLDGIRARVHEAYATLSDPIRRARYDAEKKP